ncbi:MAG: helix-turn-helix domain-containing protein [Acidimicrobiia bacterium]|nr:helix-turn-helix domain-containing protein [Acidimicrobiia bacterium]
MPVTSAALLRAARQDARLSQTDLAARAGVAQSVISAYESGRREPSLPTLIRLVEATGHELTIDVVAASERTLGLPCTPLGRRLRQRRKAIIRAAEDRRAHNVRVFGSVARGDDIESSDVDMLVDLEKGVGLLDLIGLERELAELLGVDVDVVPADSLKPRIREQIEREAVPL